jgi:hypothetical protein
MIALTAACDIHEDRAIETSQPAAACASEATRRGLEAELRRGLAGMPNANLLRLSLTDVVLDQYDPATRGADCRAQATLGGATSAKLEMRYRVAPFADRAGTSYRWMAAPEDMALLYETGELPALDASGGSGRASGEKR